MARKNQLAREERAANDLAYRQTLEALKRRDAAKARRPAERPKASEVLVKRPDGTTLVKPAYNATQLRKVTATKRQAPGVRWVAKDGQVAVRTRAARPGCCAADRRHHIYPGQLYVHRPDAAPGQRMWCEPCGRELFTSR